MSAITQSAFTAVFKRAFIFSSKANVNKPHAWSQALNEKNRLTARQVDERRCCMKVPSLTPAASRWAGGRCNAPRSGKFYSSLLVPKG
jgi:hypothetical protein